MQLSETRKREVLAKVYKLLALGNGAGATEPERDLALQRAREVLDKYSLDLADLNHEEFKKEVTEIVEESFQAKNTGQRRGLAGWEVSMTHAVCHLFNCRFMLDQKRGTVWFVGTSNDVAVAKEAWKYVHAQIMHLGDVFKIPLPGDPPPPLGVSTRTRVLDYRTGLAEGLAERIYKMKREQEERLKGSATGTELVVLKDTALQDYWKKRVKGTQKAKVAWRMNRTEEFSRGRRDSAKVRVLTEVTED